MAMSIRVQTGSRLHFGLLSLTDAPGRAFGGVGLMVQEPAVEVIVDRADSFSARGPLADRALAFAQTAALALPRVEPEIPPLGPYKVEVTRVAPEHLGLGTGTQLALAVARAIAGIERRNLDVPTLAALVGRGGRSGIGTHGFAHGGFLVDGGKGAGATIAPLIVRWDFPMAWRIVLVLPKGPIGLHGVAESEVFAAGRLLPDTATTESLCRLVLLGLLPALREVDLDAFGEALFEFNRRVGEIFQPWQGGVYFHPQIVEFIRQQGVRGVGQSSWGPALFAIADSDRATALAQQLRARFGFSADKVLVVTPANHGAQVEFVATM
jgi:beta-ribofuranosylaminobenzene 5'-phosphate synthase